MASAWQVQALTPQIWGNDWRPILGTSVDVDLRRAGSPDCLESPHSPKNQLANAEFNRYFAPLLLPIEAGQANLTLLEDARVYGCARPGDRHNCECILLTAWWNSC